LPVFLTGAALKDLMTRMGHDSERAALIYQHEARGADRRITDAIDSHVQAERDDEDGAAARSSRLANCMLTARKADDCSRTIKARIQAILLTCAFTVERVTGIEPALSAWELACHALPTTVFAAQRIFALSVSDRYRPSPTVPSGTQRARLTYR
jgi:hypothetical protein